MASISPYFEQAIHSLANCRHVVDIRNYGLAAGMTLAPYPDEPLRRPYEVAMEMWRKGFYVRYGGDTLQLGLPFFVTKEEIDRLVNALGETLGENLGGT